MHWCVTTLPFSFTIKVHELSGSVSQCRSVGRQTLHMQHMCLYIGLQAPVEFSEACLTTKAREIMPRGIEVYKVFQSLGDLIAEAQTI